MLITWSSSGKEAFQGATSNNKGDPPTALTSKTLSKIPAMMKRRLTPLGRLVVGALYDATHYLEKNDILTTIPWVVASRHGDADRVGNLLTDISAQDLLSPMTFSQSVHNAIIGTFSIATKNTAMHTAIAAETSSFEMGLLETYALQKEKGGFVGYVYYDTTMLKQYDDIIPGNALAKDVCLVLILGPDDIQTVDPIGLTYLSKTQQSTPAPLSVDSMTSFLQNNSLSLEIEIPGGAFRFDRPY